MGSFVLSEIFILFLFFWRGVNYIKVKYLSWYNSVSNVRLLASDGFRPACYHVCANVLVRVLALAIVCIARWVSRLVGPSIKNNFFFVWHLWKRVRLAPPFDNLLLIDLTLMSGMFHHPSFLYMSRHQGRTLCPLRYQTRVPTYPRLRLNDSICRYM